jgi:hypothetical protein
MIPEEVTSQNQIKQRLADTDEKGGLCHAEE